jgi:pyruvate formate lyase activating enzyme
VEKVPVLSVDRISIIDYPGLLSAKLHIAGCNFRCPTCNHFSHVIKPRQGLIPEKEVLYSLYSLRRDVTAVTLGGGEPTLHNGLVSFVYKIRALGYKIKLDTNGTKPKRINKLLEDELVDYITMDVKAPFKRYREVVDNKVDVKSIEQSIQLLRKSDIPHDFRLTMIPSSVEGDDLLELTKTLAGARRLVLQTFKVTNDMCPMYDGVKPYSRKEMVAFRDMVSYYFNECVIKY